MLLKEELLEYVEKMRREKKEFFTPPYELKYPPTEIIRELFLLVEEKKLKVDPIFNNMKFYLIY